MTKDKIRLVIPGKAQYLSLARLAISGIAIDKNMNMDDLEDLKLLITEACNLSFKLNEDEDMTITLWVNDEEITFHVDGISEEKIENDAVNRMSEMIIDSLADEVAFKDFGLEITKTLES